MAATTPQTPQFCTQTDVELSVGGSAVLVQLLDKDGDGVADANLVTAVIAHACSDVCAAVEVHVALSALVAPYPDKLVFTSARRAAAYAWTMGGAEIVVPDGAKLLFDQTQRDIDEIRTRGIALAATTEPATTEAVAQINADPDNNRVTRTSLAGSIW